MSLLCRLGLHRFDWPPHRRPSRLWTDFNVECTRGCGARGLLRCHDDTHWRDKHDLIADAPSSSDTGAKP